MNAELIDAGASMAYLNGLTGYEQTGRLQRPTLERMTRPARILAAGPRPAGELPRDPGI
jgi:hypothetical protein